MRANFDNFDCTCTKAPIYDLKIVIDKLFFAFARLS
jgi:hypothetical protein